jgi:Cu2+-exporting ATPase
MERAQAERPHLAALAEGAAQWFVLAVLISALLTGVICHSVGIPWFERVLAVLVVTCPCALALATPAAITSAIHGLMQKGALVVRAQAVETLAAVTHVVFDKTGTLTRGNLHLNSTHCFGTLGARECLRIAAALESQSEHPLGRALLQAWAQKPAASSEVINVPGGGIEGVVDGGRWYLGDEQFVRARIKQGWSQPTASTADTQTSVWLAGECSLQCQFLFGDSVRSEAADLVEFLHRRGIRTALMSGDHTNTAAAVAKATGIAHCYAELSPEQKLAGIREMQQQGAVVMMVGDGINDAPVLAGAQVSIAMGVGADLAKANADVVLMRDDLHVIEVLLRQAARTRAVIRGNIAWAIAYNALALPAAMLGWVNPLFAALGMSSSSLLVLANAWRLRRASG